MMAGLTSLEGKTIRLCLTDAFRVLGPDGSDLTPLSVKACAILGMIATSPELRRGRGWIKNRLWSDRQPVQAAGSLRQALLEIRRSLGPYAGALGSDRGAVWLVADRVRIEDNIDRTAAGLEASRSLADLDVRDPAFREWVEAARNGSRAGTGQRPPPRRPAVVVEIVSEAPGRRGLFTTILFEELSRSIIEAADMDVLRGPLPLERLAGLPQGALYVEIQLVDLPDGTIWLRARLEDMARTMVRWSASVRLQPGTIDATENLEVLAITHQIAFAVIDALSTEDPGMHPSPAGQAAVMAAAALRRMFRLHHDELRGAAELLDHAIALVPRGLYHALRAQLSTIRLVERESSVDVLRAGCETDIIAALAAEPGNSSVLAAVSNARLVFTNDVASSLVLSRQSVRSNRANPLAWWSLANAALYAGNTEEAHAAAVSAQNLARNSALRAWADFQRALTAAMCGNVAEGIEYAQSAHALSPCFRPPLRYLIALNAKAGDVSGGRMAADRLAAIEPDFSLRRMMHDESYPASMLRRSALADTEALTSLEI
jgi:tetratricopeptide (TPR) repeat protein